MKITTNFATPVGGLAPYLAGICFLLTALSVIVSVILFMSANRARAEMPMLEERLARYLSLEVPVPASLLPDDKLVMLTAQIKALNGLAGPTRHSLPQLLARIEGLIPDQVWLVSLQYRVREGEAKLVAEADHPELLTEFMSGLEQSGFFSQVLLTRQIRRMDDAQTSVQFEIQLRGK